MSKVLEDTLAEALEYSEGTVIHVLSMSLWVVPSNCLLLSRAGYGNGGWHCR
jgi:hypothetical protein